MQILRLAERPFRHFVRVGRSKLWSNANFEAAGGNLLVTSCVLDVQNCGKMDIFHVAELHQHHQRPPQKSLHQHHHGPPQKDLHQHHHILHLYQQYQWHHMLHLYQQYMLHLYRRYRYHHQLDLWQGQYRDLQAFPTDKPIPPTARKEEAARRPAQGLV